MGVHQIPEKSDNSKIKVHSPDYEYTGLDARLEGTDLFSAPANTVTTFYKDFTFDCKFNGIEIFAFASKAGDKVDLLTEYYAAPLTAWKRYKKFAKSFNVFPTTLQKYILFPTEPSVGVRLAIKYTNTHATEAAVFSANLFQFTPSSLVDTSVAAEGEDW